MAFGIRRAVGEFLIPKREKFQKTIEISLLLYYNRDENSFG